MGTLANKELLQGGVNVDVEKRFFQKSGNAGGRNRLYFRRWSGASRQSARYAYWMPDVACQRHARQGLSRHDQATCRGWISNDGVVLASRLRGFGLRRSRQILGNRAPENFG